MEIAEAVFARLLMVIWFLLAGILLQWLGRLSPLREQTGLREQPLDWLALFLSANYGVVFGALLAPIYEAIPTPAWAESMYGYLERCPALVGCVAYYLTYDFVTYWLHRALHSKALWSVHAFHHSSLHLNYLSGRRESPLDYLIKTIAGTIAAGLAPIFGPGIWVGVVYSNFHNSFIHTNLKVRSRLFNWIFMAGETHFIHHAQDLRWGNSNFGVVFTFWDRLFGTYVDPRTVPNDFPLGLPYPIQTSRLIVGLPAPSAQPAAEGVGATP